LVNSKTSTQRLRKWLKQPSESARSYGVVKRLEIWVGAIATTFC
jgi:hypothetical protein